jgi:signal transduction histidine kinase
VVSLTHILKEAVALVGNMAAKNQNTLRLLCSHRRDQISGVEAELTIAITNLLTNGVQASPIGSAIEVTTRDRSGREVVPLGAATTVEINIRDYGSGITKEHVDNIFAPFYTTKKSGTGLGLYTARRTILDHGGSINVQSQPGAGTRFQIVLPGA